MQNGIVSEELELLGEVSTLLAEVPYIVPPSEKEMVAALLRLRAEIPKAKDEDKGSLLAQYDQQYNLLMQLREARDRPQVNPDCPYFAHLRLEEKGRTRDLCLGKATRIQRGVRIVDWRNAPVSRIFYSYQQGEEYEEELGDVLLAGRVVARRTVTIRSGHLQRIDAPEGTWLTEDRGWQKVDRPAPKLGGGEGSAAVKVHNDGAARHRRLGTNLAGHRRRADKRLPDIAGLIDPDQFELITRPSSGFVVVRGTAGSGKTTVALHRIAYLAYNDPTINSPRTLFVVFSRALRDYVSQVMPNLGVDRAEVVTFHRWASQRRREHFKRLPKKIRDDTPYTVTRIKLHPVMMKLLEEQINDVDGPSNADQAIDDWLSITTQPERLVRLFQREAPGAFTESELRRAAGWCRDRAAEILAWIDGDREVDAELDVEDMALLLRAWQLRVGPLRFRGRRPLRYRHVAIDEVQDLSPIEVRVLLDCLDKNNSITLAGDTQQHVMKDAGFTSWSDFFQHLGVEGTAVDTLRVAYRSSHQVVRFAMALLGELQEDDHAPITTRSGPPVELFRFTDHGAAVAYLIDVLNDLSRNEPLASVALVTPSVGISGLYYEGLDRGDVPRLRRVTDHFSFRPGVEITEIPQVKGLEFDYVIVVEASAAHFPDTPSARRLLHVAATRAVHQLWILSVGTPSPIVRVALEQVGERG